jgi:L-fucose isomerase-like protein
MGIQDIIGASVGNEKTWGACTGRLAAGPFTFARVSTDDLSGEIIAYIGEGEFTDDPLSTFGGTAVAHVDDLQYLLTYICTQGFEHHVAVAPVEVSSALEEALGNYLGWDVYAHGAD